MSEAVIRVETPEDVDGIREVNIAAFRDHPFSQQTEHLIVDALRAAGAVDISLVAISVGRVIGHIAFSKARLDHSDTGWFLLGPVAVLPAFQGQGTGSALVESGLERLREVEARGCVLVGDAAFYRRFGFGTFPGLEYDGVPHEHVLGLPLSDVVPRGVIRAHDAFEIEPG
jgi:putative acetyltransferase